MKFDKKSRKVLIFSIFLIAVLSQFLPTLNENYTNSDSPAHFANALLVTSEFPIEFPVDVFHYRFYSKFVVSGEASVSVDAHLPLPPMYLFLLYPFYNTFAPMAALSMMYLLMALFSGLGALIIYKWVKEVTGNHSAGFISAFIYAIMPIGYLYYAGGDFPQIMGQFFVLLSVFCIYKFYDRILDIKVMVGLTILVFISLLVHLGSTVGLITILFCIFLYYVYKLFEKSSKEDNFFKLLFGSKEGKKIMLYSLSILIAVVAAYFAYYSSFLYLFLEASSKSTTGTFLVPQLTQIYQLWWGYWFFILVMPFGWFFLKEQKKFRTYIYLWLLVALIYFILNIEIRFVYLIYPIVAIVSGIVINKFFDDKKYRKYVIWFLIFMYFITLLVSANGCHISIFPECNYTGWNHFAQHNYMGKILNILQSFRP
jgi:hypothetical protein